MTENHYPQQEITAQLAEITETMQREKIEFSPGMKKYFDKTLAGITDKMAKGQMPVKSELDEFIKTIREYIEKERFLKELEGQYQKRLETGAYFGLYDKDNPVVKGIDGKKYHAPTLDEIKQAITPEHLEKVKKYLVKPMLLVVPIAMPLEQIARKVGGKNGKLPKQNKVSCSYGLNADKLGDLIYFPDTYEQTNPGGISKDDLLKQKDGFNKFPGWQVLIVDGDDEVQNGTLNKSAEDLLAENKKFGITGTTPEEWLILHASGVQEKGKPFEEKNWSWCTSSYLKTSGQIPDCLWGSRRSRTDLGCLDPFSYDIRIGGRRSVRIW